MNRSKIEMGMNQSIEEFEDAYRNNRFLPIEPFLDKVDPAEQRLLFVRLLTIELSYRQKRGEHLQVEDFNKRYPPYTEEITKVFLEATSIKPASNPQPLTDKDASTSSDRNLLLGILALQLNFVDRDELISSMNAWVIDKDKSLAKIFEERGALTFTRRQLLESLVNEHVTKHGDVEKSLQQLSSIDPLATIKLEGIADDNLHASLVHVRKHPGELDENMYPTTRLITPQRESSGRFKILRPHRRGGLGEVFRARDTELSREVALKEIQDQYANNPDSRARFLREAEITGRLEHPGIVPVYGLGTYENGRPYYAMRFIEGDSLQDAVKAFHANPLSKSVASYLSTEVSLAYRELLRRFIDVCQAIHYAHSRGVLHRDLKPGNIMLGEYGETLVVDWGLAKSVDAAQEPSDSIIGSLIRPTSGSDSLPTMTGNVMGTIGYMSPEQAAGEIEKLGPATDIYSLGATLFHLLTGTSPFKRCDSIDKSIEIHKEGIFQSPRSLNPAIDPTMESICLKAMAKKPADRYLSARLMAQDIERYLADEAVSTYKEPFVARAKRWARKHPAVTTGSIASLMIGLVSAGVIAILAAQHANQLQLKSTEIEAKNQTISKKNEDLVLARDVAEAKRVEAEKAQKDAEAVTDFMVTALRSPDPGLDGSKITVVTVLAQAEKLLFDSPLQTTSMSRYRQLTLLNAIGQSYIGLGQYQDGVRLCEQAYALSEVELGKELKGAVESKSNLRFAIASNLGASYFGSGKYESAIKVFEEAIKQLDTLLRSEKHVVRRVVLSEFRLLMVSGLGKSYIMSGRETEGFALVNEIVDNISSRPIQQASWSELEVISTFVEACIKTGKRMDDAISMQELVVLAKKEIGGESHPETIQAIQLLGQILVENDDPAPAIPMFEEATKSSIEKLGKEHPVTESLQNDLAKAYWRTGDLDKSIPMFELVLQEREKKYGRNHADTVQAIANVGINYRDAGRLTEALPLLKEAHNLIEEREELKWIEVELAVLYWKLTKLDQSIPMFEKVVKDYEEAYGRNHLKTMNAIGDLGINYRDAGRFSEALQLMKEAYEFSKENKKLRWIESEIGALYWKQGLLDQSIPIFEKIVADHVQTHGRSHSKTMNAVADLGVNYRDAKRTDDAIVLLEEVYEYAKIDPTLRSYTVDLQNALLAKGDFERAIAISTESIHHARQTTANNPARLSSVLATQALMLLEVKRFSDSERLAREALEIRQSIEPDAWTTFNTMSILGGSLMGQDKMEEVETYLVDGLEGLKKRESEIPIIGRHRITQASDRLAQFYEKTGQSDKAEKYKQPTNNSEVDKLNAK